VNSASNACKSLKSGVKNQQEALTGGQEEVCDLNIELKRNSKEEVKNEAKMVCSAAE
jgi:hypothetical protein